MIVGIVIGFLVGLLWCYYKQIQNITQNANVLSSGANLASAAQDFYEQIKVKL